jgi:hypothetical protein
MTIYKFKKPDKCIIYPILLSTYELPITIPSFATTIPILFLLKLKMINILKLVGSKVNKDRIFGFVLR